MLPVLSIVLLLHATLAQHSKVHCETTKGPVDILVHHDWAPRGAARFMELVRDGFYTDIAFYRCVEGFLTQFGISDRKEMRHWHNDQILDDPNTGRGIRKHYVSFAGGGPNTRSTQIFIAFEDLDFLGKEPWETAFGEVVSGDETLERLYKGYGDISPFNKKGPDQVKLFNRGNAYIRDEFPKIDFLLTCEDISEGDGGGLRAEEGADREEAEVSEGIEEEGEDAAGDIEGEGNDQREDDDDQEEDGLEQQDEPEGADESARDAEANPGDVDAEDREAGLGKKDEKDGEDAISGGVSKNREPKVLSSAADDEEEEERIYVASSKLRHRGGGVNSILPLYVGFVAFVLLLLLVVYRSSIFRMEIYRERSKTT